VPEFRKKPVVIEAWPVRELNRCAQHDWYALPQCIRDDYESKHPKGQGAWVFGALVETFHCPEDSTHSPDKSDQFCAQCCAEVRVVSRRGIYVPTLKGTCSPIRPIGSSAACRVSSIRASRTSSRRHTRPSMAEHDVEQVWHDFWVPVLDGGVSERELGRPMSIPGAYLTRSSASYSITTVCLRDYLPSSKTSRAGRSLSQIPTLALSGSWRTSTSSKRSNGASRRSLRSSRSRLTRMRGNADTTRVGKTAASEASKTASRKLGIASKWRSRDQRSGCRRGRRRRSHEPMAARSLPPLGQLSLIKEMYALRVT